MVTLQRRLDDIEVHHLRAAPAYVAEYDGTVDDDALARSFRLLCARYPVLRARIGTADHDRIMRVVPGHHPDFVTGNGGEDSLLREVFGEWDPARAVVRLMNIRCATGGFVALRIDHAIIDGYGLRTMFDELWHIYYAVLSRSAVAVGNVDSLPAPPSAVLAQRWSHSAVSPPSTRGDCLDQRSGGAVQRRVRPIQGYIRLDPNDTSRLVSAARAHRTSVHALICGAVLTAQRDHGPQGCIPARMRCLSPVNIRQRLVPPVAVADTTCLVGTHVADVSVSSAANPVDVGRTVKAQLDAAIDRRRLLLPTEISRVVSAPLSTPLEQRVAAAQVSNNGVVHARLPQLPDLTITNIMTPVDVINVVFPIYGVHTYLGRLTIRYLYASDVFAQNEVDSLTEEIRVTLDEIAE